jgi:glycosyltransferase involved in cell wall biosynthesis
MGKTKKVVYFAIDHFPQRFANPIINRIYHFIDKICVKYADEVWNASLQMEKSRIKNGINNSKKQYTVPMGIWFNQAQRISNNEINRFKLVYIGHLIDFMGIDLVIRCLPKLIRIFPKIHLEIIGNGVEEENLKTLVNKLKLGTKVKFYGLITDPKVKEKLLQKGGVGLATFNTTILDDKVKNADPIKMKEYTQYGMPIIVSDAISTKHDIQKYRPGIVITYSEKSFIKAVTTILKNKKIYDKYRSNALKYAQKYDWYNIYYPNVIRVLDI